MYFIKEQFPKEGNNKIIITQYAVAKSRSPKFLLNKPLRFSKKKYNYIFSSNYYFNFLNYKYKVFKNKILLFNISYNAIKTNNNINDNKKKLIELIEIIFYKVIIFKKILFFLKNKLLLFDGDSIIKDINNNLIINKQRIKRIIKKKKKNININLSINTNYFCNNKLCNFIQFQSYNLFLANYYYNHSYKIIIIKYIFNYYFRYYFEDLHKTYFPLLSINKSFLS
jgi:hypothetical protein